MYKHRNFKVEQEVITLCDKLISDNYPLLHREKKELDSIDRTEARDYIDYYYRLIKSKTYLITSGEYKYSRSCMLYIIKTNIDFLDSEHYLRFINNILINENARRSQEKDISNTDIKLKHIEARKISLENEKFISNKKKVYKKTNREVIVKPKVGMIGNKLKNLLNGNKTL